MTTASRSAAFVLLSACWAVAAGCGGGANSPPTAPADHSTAGAGGDASGPASAATPAGAERAAPGGGPSLGGGTNGGRKAAGSGSTPPAAPASNGASATSEEMPRVVSGQAAGREAREQSLIESAARRLSDPKFSEFHAIASRYLEVVRTMRPLDEKFADGTITPEERERYWKLDAQKSELWEPIHAYMYQDRWSKEDRKAMGQWLALMGNAPNHR